MYVLKSRDFVGLGVAALLAAFVVFSCGTQDTFAAEESLERVQELVIETQSGESHRFSIELAVTQEQQAKGLMFRTSMPENHGMLFVFSDDATRSFWMKNTFISLDLFFVENDGRIQHIHKNATPHSLDKITSGSPARAVLEVNAGVADRLGIQPGDRIVHSEFVQMDKAP